MSKLFFKWWLPAVCLLAVMQFFWIENYYAAAWASIAGWMHFVAISQREHIKELIDIREELISENRKILYFYKGLVKGRE